MAASPAPPRSGGKNCCARQTTWSGSRSVLQRRRRRAIAGTVPSTKSLVKERNAVLSMPWSIGESHVLPNTASHMGGMEPHRMCSAARHLRCPAYESLAAI